MPKVYSEVYGCSANVGDNQIMLGMLREAGYEIVDNPHDADVGLITTCAVKNPTVNRMIFRIKDISKLGKPLIVSGCLTKTERKVIENINSNASLVGPDSIHSIVDVAEKTLLGKKEIEVESRGKEKVSLPHVRTNPVVDIVEINSGCLSNCSFCATKLARGNLFSYRPHLVRKQIEQGLKEGCKEFWITSQDSSAYGRDIGTNLPDLIESISKIEGDFFVRVGMMNPLHFKKVEIEDLVQAYKSEKVFKFLHLCVQSGSNKVLQDMRRGYTVEDFLEYVKIFRKEIPGITIETDIIVGFPTETGEDFQETIDFVEEVRPSLVNVSRYSSRPKTSAAKMKPIDSKIVSSRSKIMHDLVRKISLEENKKWIGWQGKILVDEKVEGGVIGRNYAYKPVVIQENFELGENVAVKINRASTYFVGGEKQ
jgi:MiaB-like tRNA modifying enzyme